MVGRITDNGFTVTFNAKTAEIMDKNGRVAVIADCMDGLYFIRRRRSPECKSINPSINTKNPFPKESERETEIRDIVHSDVCGPMRTQSNGKARYFVTFIDDSSRCEVSFIRSKNEVLKEFEDFRALIERQHWIKMKCLQSDNGKEY